MASYPIQESVVENNPQVPNYSFAFSRQSGPQRAMSSMNSQDLPTNIPNKSPFYNGPVYKNGDKFLAYKDFGGRFTQFQPVSLNASTWKKMASLPTDNTKFRYQMMGDGINIGNSANQNWTFTTQTKSNPSADTLYCTTSDDCKPFGPKYTCNSNYEPWNDAYGNQSGSFCSFTAYPELDSGVYTRKSAAEGGIGKSCIDNSDCGSGYECNNNTDIFGSNIQQTGFCAQTYTCANGEKRYLGYPYNSGIPVIPSASQNNGGFGYSTSKECQRNASAQQDCVKFNERYFATYPGYCPVQPTMRAGGNPAGALIMDNGRAKQSGFILPGGPWGRESTMGGTNKNSLAFNAFNINSKKSNYNDVSEPLKYELSLNR